MPSESICTQNVEFSDIKLAWHQYLQAWDLSGNKIPEDKGKSNGLEDFFKDTLAMLERIAKVARPKIRYGIYSAASVGDDISLFKDGVEVKRLNLMRSQVADSNGDCLCLADWVSPLKNGKPNSFVGLYAATVGSEAEEFCKALKSSEGDYAYIMAQTLCDMIAEGRSSYAEEKIFAPLLSSAVGHSGTCTSNSRYLPDSTDAFIICSRAFRYLYLPCMYAYAIKHFAQEWSKSCNRLSILSRPF